MKTKTIAERSLELHYQKKGKIEVVSTVSVANREDLSLAYTPGVATPCLEIQKNIDLSYELTRRWNMCLVVTDGTAVLGLGDIGPEAAMPVMEGKAALFKAFGGVDAFPMCLKTKDVDEIVRTIYLVSGSFGGVNLEDISAPRCFEIEQKLQKICDIPIFHDDQHGTAIVTLAGLINALKVVNKKKEEVKVIINGAGAAGAAITKLMLVAGFTNIIICDRSGAIYQGRLEGMNSSKEELAKITNLYREKGTLKDVLINADVFIGVSAANVLTTEMVKTMAPKAIIFACANPNPEIIPDDAISNAIVVGGMGRERNLVLDHRITDFTPTTHIKGTVNRDGIRKMTPREWARLQGFPDNYLIPVADASAYKQFGNSVAVPAIQATANEILKLIGIKK